MKRGDLVKYVAYDDAIVVCSRDLFGIIVRVGNRIDGYYTVAWNDGSYDEDLVHSELELINESR